MRPVFTIQSALQWAKTQLNGIDEIGIEDEILLAHLLNVSRAHLHAWPHRQLSANETEQFSKSVQRRAQGEPIAYITGRREFWSLELNVTKDTLIPRPETELLVEIILNIFQQDESPKLIADLGTGSGAIAIALASERSHWHIHATDNHLATLKVAKANAAQYEQTNITFHEGNWCQALPRQLFDAIISNPPYIAEDDPALCRLVRQNEPHRALISNENGYADISKIILESVSYIKPGGYLLLEHGLTQAEMVKSLMKQAGYKNIRTYQDLAGLDRATIGQYQIDKIAS